MVGFRIGEPARLYVAVGLMFSLLEKSHGGMDDILKAWGCCSGAGPNSITHSALSSLGPYKICDAENVDRITQSIH